MRGFIALYLLLGLFWLQLWVDTYRETVNPTPSQVLMFCALIVFAWPWILYEVWVRP